MCEGLLYQVVHTELMYLPHMNHDLISSGANDFTSCKTLFWTEHCFESTLSRFFFTKSLLTPALYVCNTNLKNWPLFFKTNSVVGWLYTEAMTMSK